MWRPLGQARRIQMMRKIMFVMLAVIAVALAGFFGSLAIGSGVSLLDVVIGATTMSGFSKLSTMFGCLLCAAIAVAIVYGTVALLRKYVFRKLRHRLPVTATVIGSAAIVAIAIVAAVGSY